MKKKNKRNQSRLKISEIKRLKANKINISATKKLIKKVNQQWKEKENSTKQEKIILPQFETENSIIDCRKEIQFSLTTTQWQAFKSQYGTCGIMESKRRIKNNLLSFNQLELNQIGMHLIPLTGFGILNGGSATSYADEKKNREFNKKGFKQLKIEFKKYASSLKHLPKALAPVIYNHSQNLTFLELKLRQFIQVNKQAKRTINSTKARSPIKIKRKKGIFFQMTSPVTEKEIKNQLNKLFSNSKFKSEAQAIKFSKNKIISFNQKTNCALQLNKNKFNCFMNTNGKEGEPLALAGGHGLFFFYAKKWLKKMKHSGIKFITIGNIDNAGYSIKPEYLAILALSQKDALFETVVRTETDTKGGILIKKNHTLECAELGSDISLSDVISAEQNGNKILFNCAIGWIKIDVLLENINNIINNLPLIITQQSKSIGTYWQAEQNLWHSIPLFEKTLFLAVNKEERFVSAKFLIETLIASNMLATTTDKELESLKNLGNKLHRGLTNIIDETYKTKD